MKKILFVFLILMIAYSGNAQEDKRLKGLSRDLNKILDVTNAPGFAVAVVEGDKIIYSKGFGFSDLENKIPSDANTLYAIGSTTKAFTSAILGQLQEEGKLSLDDKPGKYIPELKFYNDEMNNNIIIQDLMSHRTGLPRHDFSWYLFPSNSKDSVMQRIEFQEPFTGVRQQWYYNNFMFLTQGVIAERITGKSWEENIEERFFIPLGMDRSNTSIQEMKDSENAALGYDTKDDKNEVTDYYDIAGMSPAGSINSSVNDMSKWLRMWIKNGKFNGKEILPSTYIKDAISSHAVVDGALPDDEFPDIYFTNYGYGWFLMSYKGHYRVGHGGNIDGFSANVTYFPSDSIGIIVLTNQNGSAVPGLVRNTIADRMLKAEKTDWAKRYKERVDKAKKNEEGAKDKEVKKSIVTKPSHILQEYTGSYSNTGYGDFDINLVNDSLIVDLKYMDFYLKHDKYDIFKPQEIKNGKVDSTDIGGLKFNFKTNDAGDISSVQFKAEASLKPIDFKRTPNTIEVEFATLDKYVGTYELMGSPMEIYIKDDNVLYLFVEGQPEYELIATDIHEFSFKSVEGFKVEFIESIDGKINEFMLFQPHGNYSVTRKE